jgi:hypothetical protein
VGAAFVIAVFAVIGLAVYSAIGHPGAGRTAEASAIRTADQPAPGSAALMAYLNPETGEIEVGPAPAADLALDADTQNALRRDDEGLVKVHHADGSVSMDLQGRFQSVSVVQINPDGTATTTCTDNAKAVEQALSGQAVGPSKPEVK